MPRGFFVLGLCCLFAVLASALNISCVRSSSLPLISSDQPHNSSFLWNYNTAFVPQLDALLVRVQNRADPADIYSTTPSQLALVPRANPQVTNDSVVVAPGDASDNFGVEDPRVFFWPQENIHLLTYTAAQQYDNGTVVARLALATSQDGKLWKKVGAMTPDLAWSKSGAVVTLANGSLAMIFGDSTVVAGLQLAVPAASSAAGILQPWTVLPGVYLPVRAEAFDSALVEAGPPPMALSDGSLLFIYNSARSGFPSPKPGYSMQYNIGWLRLNATDLTIMERSNTPLLTPELSWEIGTATLGLTPNVVFCNGMMAHPSERDRFVIFYGGADSVVGVADVIVRL